jgi:hypothetical protein
MKIETLTLKTVFDSYEIERDIEVETKVTESRVIWQATSLIPPLKCTRGGDILKGIWIQSPSVFIEQFSGYPYWTEIPLGWWKNKALHMYNEIEYPTILMSMDMFDTYQEPPMPLLLSDEDID